ncbi:TonB-dependent receptor [Pelobium manganitolerans]|uniref:TonB-dependent receptor n=1 Tax=Pelobium manganitolerans TaxID=1842495 RepID=UPI001FEBBBFB|nr:TonB-dependent receptor [Pelobium manganitolerans]
MVTAQKTQTNLQNTPTSVSVLDAQDLQNSKIWYTDNLSAITPNMYAGHSGDYRTVNSIRGVVTTSYDPAVATYIDGVNQFGLDTYIAQLGDLEKVEILRGPQSTLFGRNATGGVINITTTESDNKSGGYIDLSYGNYNAQRYVASIKTAILPNKLLLSASGMFLKQDGFYKNNFTNSSYDDQTTVQGNYHLKYNVNNRLSFGINFKHQQQNNEGAFPLSDDASGAFSQPFVLDQNAITQMRDRTFNASVSAKYYHPQFTLTTQTAYQENYRYYTKPIDGDFSPFDIITVINNYGKSYNKVGAFTQEFRFASPATDSDFSWQIGAYGFLQDDPVKQGTHFGEDARMYGSPMTNFTSINTNLGKSYGLATFAHLTYKMSSKLDVTAGMRYDYEHQKQNVKGEFVPDGGAIMVTRTDTSSVASFNALSPKLALSFKATTKNFLYLSYSRGFRAGGISQLSAEPSEPPLVAYKPEYSNNFELGSKNTFLNKKLRLNLALFYMRLSDVQVPTLILPDAITVTQNTGELNSKGAELELSAVLLKGLRLDYNFGYTSAKYKNLILENQGNNVNYKNNAQIFTPRTTSFLGMQYQFGLSKQYKLLARGEWKSIGKQYFDLKNTISQSSYNILNARLSLKSGQKELALWGSNITNTRYISYAYNFGAAHLGNPKTYGLSLISKF